jgi:hypothetical protein
MAILTVSAGGVPIGNYTGRFAGTEEVPPNPEKNYGPGLRWKWIIDAGPYDGQPVSRVTTTAPTFKNACGKMLSGLLARALKDCEQIDLDALRGKRYMLVVAAGQEGNTRVEAAIPLPES